MKHDASTRPAHGLLALVAAVALLTLAVVPAWGVRHISLDGLGAGETLPAPRLLLSAVHL
jgi:hypothetical protein